MTLTSDKLTILLRRTIEIGYEIICFLIYYSGIYHIISHLKRHKPIILTYHSINNKNCPHIYPDNIITTENFEKQISYLKKQKRIITLTQLLQHLKNAKPPENAVAITFDDGYYDFYTNAYPILKKHKIPCTLFLITELLDTGKPKWEDSLAYAINTTKAKTLTIQINKQKHTYKLTSPSQKLNCIRKLNALLTKTSKTKREKILSQIKSQLKSPPKIPKVTLTWKEIKTIQEEGLVTIGCHTHSHQSLAKTNPKTAETEISKSKEKLEKFLNQPCTLFCYPIGKKSDFNQKIKELLKEKGFHAACTTIPGSITKNTDPYELRRISALDDSSYKFKCSLIGITLQKT